MGTVSFDGSEDIHGKPENDGFKKQNLNYFRFQV